ncbi:hypothetical protein HDU84_006480 [Entophlyctis sp. JEL0112]|nr:hypothetical protein HDU84_006480 [Entophlyctis sp. JEL0112]
MKLGHAIHSIVARDGSPRAASQCAGGRELARACASAAGGGRSGGRARAVAFCASKSTPKPMPPSFAPASAAASTSPASQSSCSASASPSAAAAGASAELMQKDMSHHAAITDALLALHPHASLSSLAPFAFLHDDPQQQQQQLPQLQRSPPHARSSRSLASFSGVSTATSQTASQTTSMRSQKSVRFADPPVSFTISRSVFEYMESDEDADSSNEASNNILDLPPHIHLPTRMLSDGEDDLSDFGSSHPSIDTKRRLARSSRRAVSDFRQPPNLVDELDALRMHKSSSVGASSSLASSSVRQPRSILKPTEQITPPPSSPIKTRSLLRSNSAIRAPSLTSNVAVRPAENGGSITNTHAFNNNQGPSPSLGNLMRSLSNSSLLRKKKNLTKDDLAHRAGAINF